MLPCNQCSPGQRRTRWFFLLLVASIGFLPSCRSSVQVENMVDVGGHRLCYQLHGRGTPAVVLDVGVGESFQSWSSIVAELSLATSVLVYDRAGYGSSDMGPLPRHAKAEAADLRSLLRNAGVKGPYILVGHSLGGLNMQVFAGEYPADVAGMMLLDPPPRDWLAGNSFPDLKERFLRAAEDISKAAAAAGQPADEKGGRQASFMKTIASEHAEFFGNTGRQVLAVTSFGDLQLIVIAAARPNPAFGNEAEAYQKHWIEESRKLSRLSSAGEFILAERAGHHIHQDDPNLVLAAIRRLLK